jgi:hypothetical protein
MSKGTGGEFRVRIIIDNTSIEATLADSDTARDFASLLPLTLSMNDLFRSREVRSIAKGDFRTRQAHT